MANTHVYIFDFDQTLYPNGQFYESVRRTVRTWLMGAFNLPTREAADEFVHNMRPKYASLFDYLNQEHPDMLPSAVGALSSGLYYETLQEAPRLRGLLELLPGRKVIFTNGPNPHAPLGLEQLEIADIFEKIYDVTWANYKSKPHREPYERILKDLGVQGHQCTMIEDLEHNLEPAKHLGMATILLRPGGEDPISTAPYVDAVFEDATAFLKDELRRVKRTP